MKQNITIYSIANRARQLRSEHRHRHKSDGTCLIVEGEFDQQVYYHFVDPSACYIVLGYGKDKAIGALQELKKSDFLGVLCIVDADFSVLNGDELTNGNILTTDTHDLETMILKSPALRKILSIFIPKNMFQHFDVVQEKVQNKLLEIGKTIGYIRWYSEKNGLRLNFSQINYTALIDKQTLEVDYQRLQTELTKYSPKLPFSFEQLFSECRALSVSNHDVWQICCGHDLTNILAIILPEIMKDWVRDKSEKVEIQEKLLDRVGTKTKVEELLRLSYEIHFFEMTELHKRIKNWETENTSYSVLW